VHVEAPDDVREAVHHAPPTHVVPAQAVVGSWSGAGRQLETCSDSSWRGQACASGCVWLRQLLLSRQHDARRRIAHTPTRTS
jgi:hypothetical protein